ncbi:MAG: putative DNA modification/repair radical SAM protein [Prolixibacteraceae bacterium]
MNEHIGEKLKILADAAKYDVSCSSSGNNRRNTPGGFGTAVSCGVCHSFTEDGRCISLLKVLMTNNCIYDCAYCINRRSNDRPRATFTVQEIVDLTVNFYRRNYIEGLFLSSGIIKNPDHTMERLMLVAKKLRRDERYNGYIHLKAIPGASRELIHEASCYADRLSVNIEIPTEPELRRLAPEKDFSSILQPMNQISEGILQYREERAKYRKTPVFTPAGQSTQLVIGATPESDRQILHLASGLYQQQKLKRVYYSGYLPVNAYDRRLPALQSPPLVRENRLYQSDWLMRFYAFRADEILDPEHPFLDLDVDPKLAYALRHPELFPVDINRADYEIVLRVPGIGVRSARMIVDARRFRRLNGQHLTKIGVVMKRAQYFITCNELAAHLANWEPGQLRRHLILQSQTKRKKPGDTQLFLFDAPTRLTEPVRPFHFKD